MLHPRISLTTNNNFFKLPSYIIKYIFRFAFGFGKNDRRFHNTLLNILYHMPQIKYYFIDILQITTNGTINVKLSLFSSKKIIYK